MSGRQSNLTPLSCHLSTALSGFASPHKFSRPTSTEEEDATQHQASIAYSQRFIIAFTPLDSQKAELQNRRINPKSSY